MFDPVLITMLSLAVAAASITTTRSKITEALRAKIEARWPLIGALLGCPYCTSHYFAALAAAIFASGLLQFAVMWLALIAGASIVNGIMQRLNFLHEVAVMKEKKKVAELNETVAQQEAKIAELREVLFEISSRNRDIRDEIAPHLEEEEGG